jgi:hypothetical protein
MKKKLLVLGVLIGAATLLSACINPNTDKVIPGSQMVITLNGELNNSNGDRMLPEGSRPKVESASIQYWRATGANTLQQVTINLKPRTAQQYCVRGYNTLTGAYTSTLCGTTNVPSRDGSPWNVYTLSSGHWEMSTRALPSDMCAFQNNFVRMRVQWTYPGARAESIAIRGGGGVAVNACRATPVSNGPWDAPLANHRIVG